MTEAELNQIQSARVKAATAGFAQSLLNLGLNGELTKQAAYVYAAKGGLLEKRAANINAVREAVLTKVAAARQLVHSMRSHA